jgi:hypothetical protein
LATTAVFWFVLCVIMAGLEIEAEGKHGWAEKMPTWYRTSGPIAGIYRRMMGGKPLTGYHAYMFFLPVVFVHIPFVSGVPWSFAEECEALSLYFIVGVLWDFLWFVLNPHYGIRNFTKKKVWWHAKSRWVFGLFPADYLYGLIVSSALAFAGARASDDSSRFSAHLALLGWLALFTAICIALAPLYHRWRVAMDRRDDRDKTDIFHA